ncbi:hypothetical protein BC936DRAFT_138668 [Jimgerdemannia flammicorona]|uniref:Uncharacterized protein n=1 Tax=Jimgerdemannia flammicorona TaxID=994334 RepID=A0A433BUS1_9FUNG|nr:hypothetical protein BC936DRAFT_138668 [Jimgerdemannia flammicorona]
MTTSTTTAQGSLTRTGTSPRPRRPREWRKPSQRPLGCVPFGVSISDYKQKGINLIVAVWPLQKTTLGFVPLTKRKSGQLFVDEDAKPEDAIHTNNYHTEANSNDGLSTRPPGKRQKISESIAQAMPLAERGEQLDLVLPSSMAWTIKGAIEK